MAKRGETVRRSTVFPMRLGGSLPEIDVAYETWGSLNSERSNAVLLFTGLSPSAHAASSPQHSEPGWWEDMIGVGKPIDTEQFFVICINSLGSCFGSTGPASMDPRTGQHYRLSFPLVTLEDIASAGAEVVRELGIDRVAAVAGPSMGGMTALAYAMLYPDAAKSLVAISSATHALPFAIALRSLQREMIRSDRAWKGGNYEIGKGPVEGMRLARKLGLTTYRSPQEWQQRFKRKRIESARNTGEPFGLEFEIESYLDANARKFVAGFDANCYLYLSHAMDAFDVAEYGGSLQAGIDKVKVETALIIGVETDILFPLAQQQELADLLAAAGCDVTFHGLASLQGHDSFLVDMERFQPVIREFFSRL